VSKTLVPYWLLIVVAGVLIPGCGSTSGSAPVYDRTPTPNAPAVESHSTAVSKKSTINDTAAETKSTAKAAPVASVKTAATDGTKTYREGDWRPEYYVVRKGDTLYSIALDFGQDYRDLASWNALEDAAYIQIGQRIRLFPPDGQTGSAVSAVATPPAATPPGSNTAKATVSAPTFSDPKAYRAAYSEQAYADAKRVLSGGAETPAVTTAVAKPQPAPATAPAVVAAAPKQATDSGAAKADGTLSWEWPAPGKVLYGFSDGPIKKGVGIGGKPGQAVVSSAPGKVVYSGSGLRGYGNLIIVKHNDTYLSVYALNRQLLVKEGQMVAQGQKIAVMGETNGQPELHFEIRRQGKPVDPLELLPDRS
jgi:lipoprotein NlpD